MTRPASSHPPPPPPPPRPSYHHHQPLLIVFRGEATSYFLRLEATIHKKTEPIACNCIDTKSSARCPYRKQRRPLRKRLTDDRIDRV